MNTKRVAGWAGFFGIAAALAWLPDYWMPADDGEASVAVVATAASSKTRGALPAAPAAGKTVVVKDLSPAGDLFAARSWKAAPTLASVTEHGHGVACDTHAGHGGGVLVHRSSAHEHLPLLCAQ